ncbi:uncharacterized protein LOC132066487 [Lycium ferocissimum]|uniref:uncharacterized protein LOC132066487 n=1 Tax=Lycium ferocissimum TaxID=112874 RepID=UPI0028164AD1|nr:uncharacterized protein LOC132066487 [Lycium ferocissimum]
MYHDLRQHYWWARRKRDIVKFIAQCLNCQQVKYEHQRPKEFAYNNSYHSSNAMAPFEALYGRRCRSLIVWFDTFEVRSRDTDLLRESLDKVKVIQEKLLAAQSRKKEYADLRS